MREIDQKAVQASKNASLLYDFLLEYEAYILKCASKTTGRYITKNDDEWSIAMEAFCNAVSSYSYEKGNFLSFATLLIKRRLVDFFRYQKKFSSELSVNPCIFSGETDGYEEEPFLTGEILSKTKVSPDNSLKDEIEAVTIQFAPYGFSFYDLISCSPKSYKTKKACACAIKYVASDPMLLNEMRKTKSLSLKIIEKNAKVPRKILERHRKYIIAAIEIITGDYPCLAEYMRSLGEEQSE